MSESPVWNEESRDELRSCLRTQILGELRLAKSEYDEILQTCREVYIDDECPDEEAEDFVEFCQGEITRIASVLEAEKVSWPSVTDCDRLDQVEAILREKGILFWQASPCCDTCSGAELPYRIDQVEAKFPGFRQSVRGYAFFIDQNLPEYLSDGTQISVYLAYGWFSPDDSIGQEEYNQNALKIAREVCDCLRDHGFEPDWNGEMSRKIGIELNWQRRSLLV